MAAGPTGPPAVSSNRTYSTTPRRVRMYIKSGAMLGGQKVDCCEGSFERCYLLTQAIALAKRRSLTRIPFLGKNIWARLLFPYKSTYRNGFLRPFPAPCPPVGSKKRHLRNADLRWNQWGTSRSPHAANLYRKTNSSNFLIGWRLRNRIGEESEV